MGGVVGGPQAITRGSTIQFSTIFYDVNGNVTQPSGAVVEIECITPQGSATTLQLTMIGPMAPATNWTALWDTRGTGPGPVQYSVHSTGPEAPYAVGDGKFSLTADNANLVTF